MDYTEEKNECKTVAKLMRLSIFLSLTLKPEVRGSREISFVAKWIDPVLLSSPTMFSQKQNDFDDFSMWD